MSIEALALWALTVLSLVGTWLNVKKNSVGFIFWGVSNLGWIAIDLKDGAYPRAVLFTVYLALALYGLYEWRKGTAGL